MAIDWIAKLRRLLQTVAFCLCISALQWAVYPERTYEQMVVYSVAIGVSTWVGYSSNEGRILTLAMIDVEHSEPGTPVTFVWGEEGGGSSKPTVERHVQTEIRATVAPVPYSDPARKDYRAN